MYDDLIHTFQFLKTPHNSESEAYMVEGTLYFQNDQHTNKCLFLTKCFLYICIRSIVLHIMSEAFFCLLLIRVPLTTVNAFVIFNSSLIACLLVEIYYG